MNVLIGCENSGVIRRAFTAAGCNAWSCDLLPAADEADGVQHLRGDVRWFITEDWQNGPVGWKWDLFICHPDCTYLSSSGLHWNKKRPERQLLTEQALDFVREMMSASIEKIAIENPVGCISTRIDATDYGFRTVKATQYIQPYDYGHDASKKTGLWLKNLPLLIPDTSNYIEPRWIDGRPRWGNQTDSGQNKLGPSDDRWKLRAETYSGWAEAMVKQWQPH